MLDKAQRRFLRRPAVFALTSFALLGSCTPGPAGPPGGAGGDSVSGAGGAGAGGAGGLSMGGAGHQDTSGTGGSASGGVGTAGVTTGAGGDRGGGPGAAGIAGTGAGTGAASAGAAPGRTPTPAWTAPASPTPGTGAAPPVAALVGGDGSERPVPDAGVRRHGHRPGGADDAGRKVGAAAATRLRAGHPRRRAEVRHRLGVQPGRLDAGHNSPTGWADMNDAYQQAGRQSRLGIPVIYGIDSVHGVGPSRAPRSSRTTSASAPRVTPRWSRRWPASPRRNRWAAA